MHPARRAWQHIRRVRASLGLFFLFTHFSPLISRNPLGCAVAITALDVLVDERLAERAQRLGEQFRNGVRALRSPLVQEVRGRGLFNAVVIDEKASRRGRTAWQLCLLLKSRGVLAKPTHVNMYACFPVFQSWKRLTRICSIRFSPPLVISDEDLQRAVGIIKQSLIDLDEVCIKSPLLPSCGFLTPHCSSRTFREKPRARRDSATSSPTESMSSTRCALQCYAPTITYMPYSIFFLSRTSCSSMHVPSPCICIIQVLIRGQLQLS